MDSREQEEKKNNRIGLITSLGVHAALLILFLFAMAWRAPDPPNPEFGVILNVGFDTEGSGDVQTDQPAQAPETQEDQPEEQPQDEPSQPVVEDKPVEKVQTQEVVTSKIESPVAVKEEKEKVKEEPKPKQPEQVKTEYKKETQTAQQNDNVGKKTESEGNDINKTGNKGQPEGVLDPNAQYTGKAGGGSNGDGMSLSMSGWAWADQPNLPSLPDNEDGRIVFEIECDADGEIVGIKTLERGLSARAEQLLKEEIRRNSLVRTSGGQAPERSKGRIVFILKTR